jgi:choline dehydrogenase-like flavoprotein
MRDVIIIGAGGGGAIVAKELAAQGLDVLPLEGGHDSPMSSATGIISRTMPAIHSRDTFALVPRKEPGRSGSGNCHRTP